MPCNKNRNSNINESLGRVFSLGMLSLSVFVILSTFIDSMQKNISQEKLRQSYDGLSPHEYL